MIFLTVGTQVPFDRLVRVVDEWAGKTGREVFGQIGHGDYVPRHMLCVPSLDPSAYQERFAAAQAVIAHAGMGTILTALQHAKPLVVMPRRASLGEHRNEHQLATARRFRERGLVRVAMDASELLDHLERVDDWAPLGKIGASASSELLDTIRRFL